MYHTLNSVHYSKRYEKIDFFCGAPGISLHSLNPFQKSNFPTQFLNLNTNFLLGSI